MPMIRARHPEAAERLYEQLTEQRAATPSVQAVHQAQRHLTAKGYQCPDWQLVWNGARPTQGSEQEPGEWKHGWQYYAATRLETQFRVGAVLSSKDSASNALLRSQSRLCFRSIPGRTANRRSKNIEAHTPAPTTAETLALGTAAGCSQVQVRRPTGQERRPPGGMPNGRQARTKSSTTGEGVGTGVQRSWCACLGKPQAERP